MQFFKDFKSFQLIVENLNYDENLKKLKKSTIEIETDKDNANLENVLRKVNKVLNKSEVLKKPDIRKAILQIYGLLNDNIKTDEKVKKMQEDSRYVKLKEFVTELEKEDAEIVQKALKEFKDNFEKKDNETKKVDKEKILSQYRDADDYKAMSQDQKTDSKIDADKIKKMFDGTKINTKTAPILSKALTSQNLTEVNVLQQFLSDGGFYSTNEANETGLNVDGHFGEKTDAAVKAYQKSKGLTADGIVGEKTWREIFKDLNYDIDANFKTFQLNQNKTNNQTKDKTAAAKGAANKTATTNPATTTKAPDKQVKETKESLQIKQKYKELTGLDFGQKAQKLTIDQIVKQLTNQRMSAATVPTDEKEVTKVLINQINNGVLNQTTMNDLLKKYKAASGENKNGLVKDIIYAFDTDATDINATLSEMEPDKANNSIIYDAIIGFGNAARWFVGEKFSDDTASAVAIFLAFASTKNDNVITSMQAANLNVTMLNKILNYKNA